MTAHSAPPAAAEDLDFIICLSFHKLQEQNHALLPFVLIRNALQTSPPSPPPHPKPLDLKTDQIDQQHWLDACFDDLEQDDDAVMVDDFGDMMLCASAKRAGIDLFMPLRHKKDSASLPQQRLSTDTTGK